MTVSNRVLMQLKKKFYGKFKSDTNFYIKCNSNGAKSPETISYGLLKCLEQMYLFLVFQDNFQKI